ncbi:MAG TPA: beta-glucosidase BglX [Gemmatimonadaceae bacterium]|nr:beta-glucosidase BglX [Gemmatimonadaceae bacterium]
MKSPGCRSIATLLCLAAGACTQSSMPATSPSPLNERAGIEKSIDSLIALMTLDEKLGQLSQFSGFAAVTGPGAIEANMDDVRKGRVGSFFNVTGVAEVRRLQKAAVEETRLHIPIVFGLDVIHGARTVFPVPLAEASSWNPAAVQEAARIAALEASAYGISWTFAPMVDIARDPRWGRITEGSGEDAFLGSVMAAARVRGFQGSSLRDPTSIAATAKHFAAYGGAEGGRDYNVVDVSEGRLREVYLPPFRAAACAGVATFMASFNEISGVPAHANRWLLTDLLKKEWGYDGMVVSDWTGIHELIPHGVAKDSADAARLGINAGVDMEMVSRDYAHALPDLLQRNVVQISAVDEAVRRILRLKYRLGLFDDPYRGLDSARVTRDVLTPANRLAARKLAQQSVVLLRNERNTLPLSKNLKTIAVIGALAADSGATIGAWGGMGRHTDAVSVLDGIKAAVSSRTRVTYERGGDPVKRDSSRFRAAVNVARNADAVILVLGEPAGLSGEASSRSMIDLPGSQLELAQRVKSLGKPIIVVLMNGRPLAIPWLAENADAVVESWFLGIEMGNAVADILFGDVNPSGKLTATFPRNVGQVPIYYNYRRTGRPPDERNHYTSKYLDVPWTPQYPFGYGLSYTSFTYSAPRLTSNTMSPGDSIGIEFTLTNTGARPGEEVVQLYVGDEVGSITRPVMELRRFRRVALRPGQSGVIRFDLSANDLAFYNAQMRRVVEPGFFRIFVGGNSRDVKDARFELRTPTSGSVEVGEPCGSFVRYDR